MGYTLDKKNEGMKGFSSRLESAHLLPLKECKSEKYISFVMHTSSGIGQSRVIIDLGLVA